jgi:hypothetical protein
MPRKALTCRHSNTETGYFSFRNARVSFILVDPASMATFAILPRRYGFSTASNAFAFDSTVSS